MQQIHPADPSGERWYGIPDSTQTVTPTRQVAQYARFQADEAQARAARRHLWVAMVTHRVRPPLDVDTILDADSIAQAPMVMCWICEQPWEIARDRVCAGETLNPL